MIPVRRREKAEHNEPYLQEAGESALRFARKGAGCEWTL
jgi:hypothetical protein